MTEIGQCLPGVGQIRDDFGRIRIDFGQVWLGIGQFGAESACLGPESIKASTESAKSRPPSINFGPSSDSVGQHSTNVEQAKFSLGPIWANFGRPLPARVSRLFVLAQGRAKQAGVGRGRRGPQHIDQSCVDIGQTRSDVYQDVCVCVYHVGDGRCYMSRPMPSGSSFECRGGTPTPDK